MEYKGVNELREMFLSFWESKGCLRHDSYSLVPQNDKSLLLIAAGFVGCDPATLTAFSLAADQRGRLLPPNQSHQVGGKLFSAGDMRTGQSLVVRALSDGRAAAKEVHQYLQKKYVF